MRALPRFLLGSILAALAPGPALGEANYQGLWWRAPAGSESGWGINFAHQGDVVFASWYTYDASGKAWWLSMTAARSAPGTYSGTLIRSSGPPFSAQPFDPRLVTRTAVGTGTLVFSDQDNATFAYTVDGVQQTKPIVRAVFGPIPTCTYQAQPDLAAATNYQDIWWATGGAESGWGINLTHQGDVVFGSWFTYDANGAPMWLSVTANRTAAGDYAGELIRTTGPAFSAVPFDPTKVTRTVAGSATFVFADGNTATFAYTLDGVPGTKTIARVLFAPPAGTVCGEPYRAAPSFTVVAAGDIGQCFGYPAANSMAARTAALVGDHDALVLTLGDHAYELGSPSEFAECFHPTWGAFEDRIRPTPGNHDYYTFGAQGYFGYFGAQAGPADRRAYYSFDFGGWHFISLNSVVDPTVGSEQHRWLLDDLAKSRDTRCTIAYWHYPAFNSGGVYGPDYDMWPFFEALHAGGVDMVLSGHEHIYERFAPQNAHGGADPARGVRQFVVGTGGHELNPLGAPLANSEFRDNTHWGVLRLTLGEGQYSWQFVPVGGGPPIDAGTASCH